MCPICKQKWILREKKYLKAEKKRKKKEARKNERKRKREEAEKVKEDQEHCRQLNPSPEDISQAPQMEVANKGNVESAKGELSDHGGKKPKLFKENVESTKEMLPMKIRNFKFNLEEASVASLKKYLNELVFAKMHKVERRKKAKEEEY